MPADNPMNPYESYVGLYTNLSDFGEYIASQDEIQTLFKENTVFNAPFAYPFMPTDGFQKALIFKAKEIKENDLLLDVDIEFNKAPTTKEGQLAKFILPKRFHMRDRLTFFKPNPLGKFIINTESSSHFMSKKMLAIHQRAGLFLKVRNNNNGFYDKVAIYFPDKTSGKLYDAVKNGQAFVLIADNITLTSDLIEDMSTTFNKLVKKSYGDEGLYHIKTHTRLEDYLTTLRESDESEPLSCITV
jgi:hypothetical protein